MPDHDTGLTLAQNVAADVGLGIPATLGDSDAIGRQMRVLLNRGLRNMASMRNTWGAGWTLLTRAHEIPTVAGQSQYALPDDFADIVNDTIWDRDTYFQARGALSPQEWAFVRSGLTQTVTVWPLWRILSNEAGDARLIAFDPEPTGAEHFVLEYVSAHPVLDNSTPPVRKDAVEADTDRPIFAGNLVEQDLAWRFRKARGLAYDVDLAEFEMERERLFALDVQPRSITLGKNRRRGLGSPRFPYTGYGEL